MFWYVWKQCFWRDGKANAFFYKVAHVAWRLRLADGRVFVRESTLGEERKEADPEEPKTPFSPFW